MICPQCQASYPEEIEFCAVDGAKLLQASHTATMAVGSMAVTGAVAVQQAQMGTQQVTAPVMSVSNTNVEFPPSRDSLAEGAQVGEYIVQKKIGEGGMGVIFSAVHPVIGKRVALKVLNSDMAANAEMVRRFIQEAKSVNQIGHRNIVDIFSFGILPDGRHYFAMELLDGSSFSNRIARGPVPASEGISIWLQAAAAVEAAHAHGIVHRDLKPDNIFLSTDAHGIFVKVLDFGIAKLLGEVGQGGELKKTATGVPIGTPAYMSPEQVRGDLVDHRTDVYAFGIILYETIAGRPPFVGNTFIALMNAQMSESPPPLSQYANVHPELDALVMRTLAKDPAQRPQDMASIRMELSRLKELASAEQTPLYTILAEPRTAQPLSSSPTSETLIGDVAPAQSSNKGLVFALGGIGILAAVIGGVVLLVGGKKADAPAVPIPVESPKPVVAAPSPAAQTTGGYKLTTVVDVEVKIDGKVVASSVRTLDIPSLPAGPHDLVVTAVGPDAAKYQPLIKPLNILAGQVIAEPILLSEAKRAPSPGGHTAPGPKKPTGPRKLDPNGTLD